MPICFSLSPEVWNERNSELAEPVGLPALDVHRPGQRAVERLFPAVKFALRARQHPACRTLENRDAAGFLRDLGHELDGGCAIADDGDALALEVDIVVPLRRVPAIALKILAALDVGPDRPVQLAGARCHDMGGEAAVAGFQCPCAARFVETSVVDFGIEADVTAQPVFVDDGFEVVLDVGGEDIFLRPGRPHVEGVLIHVQRHVAGTTRIGVLAPGAADPGCLFVDREIGDARLFQFDRRADARDARAENGDAGARRLLSLEPRPCFPPCRFGGGSPKPPPPAPP